MTGLASFTCKSVAIVVVEATNAAARARFRLHNHTAMTTPEQKAVFRHLTKRVALDKDTVSISPV